MIGDAFLLIWAVGYWVAAIALYRKFKPVTFRDYCNIAVSAAAWPLVFARVVRWMLK